MFDFLRSRFVTTTETEEEFRVRMERLQQDMQYLCEKQPEEVAGDPKEPIYYGLRFTQALDAGEEAKARHFLSEMLRASPSDDGVRLIASTAYARLGEEAEAIAQLSIALALRPDNYAAHHRLAYRLAKRGEWQAAEAVLEKGWVYYRKILSKGEWEAKRTEYFSILERAQTT